MALTVAEAAVALRLTVDPTVPPTEPLLSLLHRQLQTCQDEVEAYAPNAPDFRKDEATIRALGWLFEAPPTMQGSFFIASGARAVLARYHEVGQVHSGTPIATVPETTLTPSTPLHPPHPGTHLRIMGWSPDDNIDLSEMLAGTQFTTDVLTAPARSSPGYLFAAFEQVAGFPDSVTIDGNPTNQIAGWRQQAGVLFFQQVNYVTLVTNAQQSPAVAGRVFTFGYSSP